MYKTPKCPNCREETETLYQDPNDEILGCPECIGAVDLDAADPLLKCPHCDEETDTVYKDKIEIVGCPECISTIDAYDWQANEIEGELAEIADQRVKQFKEDGF